MRTTVAPPPAAPSTDRAGVVLEPANRSTGRARPAPAQLAELLALLVVLGGALAIRLRDLTAAPSLTDEAREALVALDILAGERPLTNVHAYIGAGWNYVLAGAFGLFGLHPELPRQAVLVAGLATIVAAYLLARQLGGTAAGLVAATLMAVSGAHVLISSRIAWSHSTTPLFVTLAVWLLLGVGTRPGPRLAAAGLASGLALQSHITAVPLLVAGGLYVLGWRRAWLRSRWLWLGLLAFGVGYGNVLLELLQRGLGEMFDDAAVAYGAPGQRLAIFGDGKLSSLLANLSGMSLTFARLLSGAIDIRPSVAAYLRDPLLVGAVALFLMGLGWTTRRRSPLPLLVLLGWGLLMVFVLNENGAIPNGRFIMPIIPLAVVLLATGLVMGARLVPSRPVRVGLMVVVLGGLTVSSWLRLEDRLGDFRRSASVSTSLDRMVETVAADNPPAQPVYLDPMLEKLWLDGGGSLRMALRYRFRVAGLSTLDLRDRVGDERFEIDTCDVNRAVFQQLTLGRGDPLETLLPAGHTPSPGTTVWVVRAAEPHEEVRAFPLWMRSYPPTSGNGRAVRTCDRGRLI